MTIELPPHYVTGHRNPDTDSLVGAHVFAWYFRETGISRNAAPVRLGPPGPQASWIFDFAGVSMPPLLEDCRYTVGQVMRQVEAIDPDASLGEALDRIHAGETDVVPVVNSGNLVGLVSDRSRKANYLVQCNVEDMLGTLLSMEDLIRGLNLKRLSAKDIIPSPERIQIVDWENSTRPDATMHSALVIAGSQPDGIRNAVELGCQAIVIAGEYEPDEEFLKSADGPVFYRYKGSMGSLVSRLPRCFRCSEAMEEDFPVLHKEQIVSEIRRTFSKVPFSIPVVDDKGSLAGMLSAADVLALPPVQVSLIDHFEKSQTIGGIDEAVINEIIDHHRIGDIESIDPLRVDCRPVGSSATILYDRCINSGLSIPSEIAVLLLGALVSDTLLLQSPTTTELDKRAAEALVGISGLKLEEFGLSVLRKNDRLMLDDADTLIHLDSKRYQHRSLSLIAAQIETVDLDLLNSSLENSLVHALKQACCRSGDDFAILMVTDVLSRRSRIILASNSDFPVSHLVPDSQSANSSCWTAEGWVSRKKQLIPYVFKMIDEHANR